MTVSENNTQILEALNTLLFDVHFSLATEASCNGDYSLASSYISDMMKTNGDKTNVLDLSAKINAQQGNLKQAEFFWEKCIATEPGNREYIAALARLHKKQKSRVVRDLNHIGIYAGLVGLMFLLFFLIKNFQKNDRISNSIATLQNRQFEILGYLNSNQQSDKIERESSLLTEIAGSLEKIEGTDIQNKQDRLIILFDKGLFNRGNLFNVFQEPVIKQVAKALEPYSGSISIFILGCTDDVPITDSMHYNSNNALSIARASIVYDIFYNNSRILTDNLTVGSAGAHNTPFLNNSEENRKKNRTVIIRIQENK